MEPVEFARILYLRPFSPREHLGGISASRREAASL
jgi:hypothetical protein